MLNRIAPALAPGTLRGTEETLPTEGGRVRKEKKVVYVQPFLRIIEQQLINYCSLLINRLSPYAPTPTKKRKRAAPSGFRFRYLLLFV